MTDLERRLITDTNRTYNGSSPGAYFNSLLYRNGVYYAVGSGGVIISSGNAASWGAVHGGGTKIEIREDPDDDMSKKPGTSSDTLWGFTFCGGKYFATGDKGTILVTGEKKGAPDWAKWIKEKAKEKGDRNTRMRGVAFGAGKYVAIGDGGLVLVSTDTEIWETKPSGTGADLYDIIYETGKFVAVGTGGNVIVSYTGESWIGASAGSATLFGVLYKKIPPYKTTPAKDLFIALQYNHIAQTSESAFSWTTNANGAYDNVYDIIHASGLCIPVGHYGYITTSSI